jgi:hypothetical protein
MPLHPRRCTVGARGWWRTTAAGVRRPVGRGGNCNADQHRHLPIGCSDWARLFAEKFHMIPVPQI